GERAASRTDLYLDRVRGGEPIRPGQAIGGTVHIVFRSIGSLSNFPKHATGNVTLEIDPVHRGPGSLEGDPAVRLRGLRHAKGVDLLFEDPLQPSRARCKEP